MPAFLSAVLAATLLAGSPAPDVPRAAPVLAAAAAHEGLRPRVLALALEAQARALTRGAERPRLLTVIDFSLPSRQPRLWVLDVVLGRVLAHELVAHGRGSGDDLATRFSNAPGSLQSSLGTFVTGATYQGKHGLSLRLRGLDAGLNDRAEARGIVMHGADYVSQASVRALGRLGRSQGCPALAPSAARRLIPLLAGGTVVYAYYPS